MPSCSFAIVSYLKLFGVKLWSLSLGTTGQHSLTTGQVLLHNKPDNSHQLAIPWSKGRYHSSTACAVAVTSENSMATINEAFHTSRVFGKQRGEHETCKSISVGLPITA